MVRLYYTLLLKEDQKKRQDKFFWPLSKCGTNIGTVKVGHEVVKQLLECGANVDAQDKNGKTTTLCCRKKIFSTY